MNKQETIICKQCEQEIEDGTFLLEVGEELYCDKCYEKDVITYFQLLGDDEWMNDSEVKEYELDEFIEKWSNKSKK
ncbi:hypothetical protein HCB33_14315 [Listeria sp. FSL L7-0233]|uniref:LIM domain-containing protein n=1 Tax=Listeria cossartiae TaxID=2838249 RepID=UPI0016264EF4|nr:LIM domain-containing protein [Listeria cossartiae]MBC2184531.1 hypothetical protein [Listeria cossartiae subsp. cossartiae]